MFWWMSQRVKEGLNEWMTEWGKEGMNGGMKERGSEWRDAEDIDEWISEVWDSGTRNLPPP